MQAREKQCVESYAPLIYCVSPTYNMMMERLFSQCKLIFSDLKKAWIMEPAQLEVYIFLRMNMDKWDKETVVRVWSENGT